MLKRITAAVLPILLKSVVSILKRKKEEVDPPHLRLEKEEREEKGKAERIPDHQDQMPALQKGATAAPVPQERRNRNAVKSGKLKTLANGETSADFGTLPLASSMPKAIAKPEMRVLFHTEKALQNPRRTTSPQQDLLLDCRPTATRYS